MNLTAAEKLAQTLIHKHLGGTKTTWTFAWVASNTCFGMCKYHTMQICLSNILTKIQNEHEVEQTILHEIAHAMTPGSKHNSLWKCVAQSIGVINPAPTKSIKMEKQKPKWVMIHGEKIVRNYFRKPTKALERIDRYYIRGQEKETKGHLKIIPFSEYRNNILLSVGG